MNERNQQPQEHGCRRRQVVCVIRCNKRFWYIFWLENANDHITQVKDGLIYSGVKLLSSLSTMMERQTSTNQLIYLLRYTRVPHHHLPMTWRETTQNKNVMKSGAALHSAQNWELWDNMTATSLLFIILCTNSVSKRFQFLKLVDHRRRFTIILILPSSPSARRRQQFYSKTENYQLSIFLKTGLWVEN